MTNNALNNQINNFITDNTLALASNENSPTALAIKEYIDNLSNTDGALQSITTTTISAFTTSAVIPADNTIPQQSEGAEMFTVTITPFSASSILRVTVFINITQVSAANIYYQGAIFRDANADAILASFAGTYVKYHSLSIDVPSVSTDETTFKYRIGRDNLSGTISAGGGFGAAGISFINVMEILT